MVFAERLLAAGSLHSVCAWKYKVQNLSSILLAKAVRTGLVIAMSERKVRLGKATCVCLVQL